MRALDSITNGLASIGFHVEPGFIAPDLLARARKQVDDEHAAGKFKRAGVGKGGGRAADDDIRRDEILWLDDATGGAAGEILALANGVKDAVNRKLFLGLWSLEAHYAIYQAGSFYRRHRDVFCADDARVVSVVLYLNPPGWRAEDGGKLILRPESREPVEVLPEGGTLVVFLSREIDHEVTEARKTRRSFTGWFKRRV